MVELEQQWLHQARRVAFEDYRRRRVKTWIGPRGTSMRPLIGPDTWMQVEFGATEFAIGDIILFPLGNMLVAHRIVAHKLRQGQPVFVPKGDSEPYPDPLIQPSEVLGTVRALRHGWHGSGTVLGCSGTPARMAAAISRSHGHVAVLLRRLAIISPDPLRRLALNAIPPLLRVVARLILTPLSWATWLDISKQESGRR